MENHHIITTYLVYLTVTISLTLYVAHILFKNGKVYMLDIFHGREDIALATNRLFEVGFVGFALCILEVNFYKTVTYQGVIEILSQKIGGFSIYLGMMLFFNLYLFFRGKKATKKNQVNRNNNGNNNFGADFSEEQIIF